MDFHIGFDPGSLEEIVRLQGFGALLDPSISQGLIQSSTVLTNAAVANTWRVFTNSSGKLASTIYPYVVSPTEVAIAVGSPYGRRREKGFSGMTDSLGRYYANDPGKPYLQPALDEHQQDVMTIMGQAVNTALGRVAE
jgi:hypothetical protein